MDFVEEATRRSKHLPNFDYAVSGADPVVLAIQGEVDLDTAPELSAVLETLMLSGIRHVAVDMGAVDYIDSTGLHALDKATARLREAGGFLHVSSVSDRVRRVVEVSGMEGVLPLPARVDGETS